MPISERPRPPDYFGDWKQREALAEGMIPQIGSLYRRNIKSYIYGRPLINVSVLDIMQAHRFVREVEGNELSEFETAPMLQALVSIESLGSAHIDIGRLAVAYDAIRAGERPSVADFVREQVAELIGSVRRPIDRSRDVVLYGFGRIGRLLARLLIEKAGGGDTLRLRAVVVRPGPGSPEEDLEKRAALLRQDSVHGPFQGTVRVDAEHMSFVANGNEVQLIHAREPDQIDYSRYGLDNAIVVDNTGMWRARDGLSKHLDAPGASQVLLTAPGKGDIVNVVHGINEALATPDETVVAAASCTTNAVVPPLHAMHQEYGIEQGHIETVHAYTNDQNLIDNYHPAARRGRSAPLNMVLATTGAAVAAAQVLPSLAGRLTGNAIRVPVPNVSMAILHLTLSRAASADEINEYMRSVALHSELRKQIGYSNSPEAVSSDFIGSRHACVFDSLATVASGRQCVLYVWYDNEFGYSCQVHRVLESMAGVRYQIYPRQPLPSVGEQLASPAAVAG